MQEYIGNYLIEEMTGRSKFAFWVFVNNGGEYFEYVAQEYFYTYEDALNWVQRQGY